MKATVKYFVCAVLLVVLGSAASASMIGYVNPPPFEAQRTMFWDFSQGSWQTPYTLVGPTWDTGDWTCDDVTFSSNLQWFGTNDHWAGRFGMIGLDNTNGETGQTIWFKMHINNYTTPNPVKKVWFEGTLTTWGGSEGAVIPGVPEGSSFWVTNEHDQPVDGGILVNGLWSIHPNPTWEEITWTCYVPAGGGCLVDSVFTSTACVPEPSALVAFATGLFGLCGVVAKRRR